jgi:hypothetical protein
MKPSEIIKALEEDRDNWEALTGEILATLHVNLERDLLTASDPAKFARWLLNWNRRREALKASGFDLANVTFTRREVS